MRHCFCATKCLPVRNASQTKSTLHIGIVDLRRGRRILNIEQIASEIAKPYPEAKIERKFMEDLEPLRQFLWWSRQDIIVTAHGAGMINMIFLPADGAIVEIFPEHYYPDCYWDIGRASGIRNYSYFNGVKNPYADHAKHSDTIEKRWRYRAQDLEPPVDEVISLVFQANEERSSGGYSRCDEFPRFCGKFK
mmetsp:Transcript_16790/g.25376  ORF Transcript_16790/g.25376 Transcript_16790/m.25376 type:complete len:192 (-) Transcript_16790:146-721(-)|eukprot:CAMPEP_0178894984 /NCGR_PEP_ID=MMETSP0786-20121207/322_1 /TAXON_ID=186022 /ORGANISM="Thalassionema frauenfeldii, Strain CCMP 1798" /LENGTH=191 /DNA_ID=CAMNT_0020565139 /DNA_START=537 /DNA_END=1112 /DNA_ORIENTATION=+